jgi:adenylylsulfate kinase-like enzyme
MVTQARGFTLWFTGLSGAGKSTLAAAVSQGRLLELGHLRNGHDA